MKKIGFILLFAFASLNCFSQNVKTVMIKEVETYGSFLSMDKVLHVIDENGVLTTTELEKHNTTGIPKNMETIKNIIDNYILKGYVIISSTAVSFGWNGVFTIETTYILKQ